MLQQGLLIARRFHSQSSRLLKYHVPEEFVQLKFIRSSGPGGQNVNKVSTCVEARIDLDSATFLTDEVKGRLRQLEKGRINKNGELFVVVQDERKQSRNRSIALTRLSEIIEAAFVEPKTRKLWVAIGEKGKQKRKDYKEKRSGKKASRRKGFD